MNLAVRGIDPDIKWNSEGTFHKNELPDLRADVILANGSVASTQSGEGEMRRAKLNAG